MRKYPKIVQCDARGQIVIPKDVRAELGLDEGSAFWLYSITDEGILLKKVPDEDLSTDSPIAQKIKEKADKINIDPKNLDRSIEKHKRSKGKLEEI